MDTEPPQGRLPLVLTGALLLVTVVVLFWLRGALLPLLISGVLAYMLLPLVKGLERVIPGRGRKPGLVRLLSVTLVFLVIIGVFVGALIVVVPPTIRESTEFVQSIPELASNIRTSAQQLNEAYADKVPLVIRRNIRRSLANAGAALSDGVRDALVRTLQVVTNALTLIVGLAATPIVLFYLLKDREELARGVRGAFPPSLRRHAISVLGIVNDTAGSYIRGQLVLGLIVGTITMVGLFLLGVRFPVVLGLVAGLTEMIPIIGPWIGGLVGVLVTMATMPEMTPWVILFYLGVQVVENVSLVPRVQGNALGLHPIAVMVIIVVGSQVFGLWGVILGPPITAAAKEVIKYFYLEWNSSPAAADPELTPPVEEEAPPPGD